MISSYLLQKSRIVAPGGIMNEDFIDKKTKYIDKDNNLRKKTNLDRYLIINLDVKAYDLVNIFHTKNLDVSIINNNFHVTTLFKNIIRENTSIKNPVLYETFTSAYYPGDFLGRHTDEKRGVAFIFNLSWQWKPEYGGILSIENGDSWISYVPGWGDLVLLELGELGKVHFVSEVSSPFM